MTALDLRVIVGPGTPPTDVVVDGRDDATIADLAVALGLAGRPLFLGGKAIALDPAAAMADAGLTHGATISVDRPPAPATASPAGHHAELAVVGGAGGGRSVPAMAGATLTVGRAAEADLVLDDCEASRTHARITVAGDATAAVARDAGSRNGTGSRGVRLDAPRIFEPGDVLAVGATVVAFRKRGCALGTGPGPEPATYGVNRPPRLPLTMPDIELEEPAEPELPRGVRLPLAACLVPLALAGALYLFLPGAGIYTAAFLALSPIMLVTSTVGDRRSGRRNYAERRRAYELALAALATDVDRLVIDDERTSRDADPDPSAILAIAATPTTRLWERRPGDPDFLRLRFGLGDRPARVRVRSANGRNVSALTATLVPATVDLASAGVVGLAGDRPATLSVVRAALASLVTLHGPRHLRLVVLTAPGDDTDWTWTAWLPHLRPESGPRSVAVGRNQAEARLTELRRLIGQRTEETRVSLLGRTPVQGTRVVMVVDGSRRFRSLPGLAEVLADGPEAGVHAICLDDEATELPEACGAIVTVCPDEPGRLDVRRSGLCDLERVLADGIDRARADHLARALAPLRPVGGAGEEGTLPETVRLLDLLGPEFRSDGSGLGAGLVAANVLAGWTRSGGRSTVAILGDSGGSPFRVDLRTDGPHGLVAGTTGAGKSELLQTFVASLALANRPDALSFVLVDYKGGAAFADCARLPHCAGLITDLDDHLAGRALASLTAELRRRERLLNQAGAKDIDDLWAKGGRLPRLVIVVDEFATLAEEVPAFVSGVVGIGIRGRSLGVHVVLATQRPAGVVSAEIRANVNLRLCLRVADPSESADVIDATDAARISRTLPGRALARTGPGDLTPFQTARVACPVRLQGDGPAVEVRPLRLDLVGATRTTHDRVAEADAETDLTTIVYAVAKAAAELGDELPTSPWLPPLPAVVPAADVVAPAVALADRPSEQRQETVAIDPHAFGGVLVLGAPRSGRTSALLAVATQRAAVTSPDDLHIYGLDGGGQGLAALTLLPHCGAAVPSDDISRVERLLALLTAEVRRRRASTDGAAPRPEGRSGPAPPRILFLVDGMEALMSQFGDHDGGRLLDVLDSIIREGPGVGIVSAVSTDRTGFGSRLASAIPARLVLRQADREDASLAGLDARALPSEMPPGRAVWTPDGTELQLVAVDEAGVAAAAARWPVAPDRPVRRIDPLPERITRANLNALYPHSRVGVVLGVGGDELQALAVDFADLGPGFVIAGAPGSGRSTALWTIAEGLRAAGRPLVVVTPRRSPLAQLDGDDDVTVLSGSGLDEQLRDAVGQLLADGRIPAVLVDDAELLGEGREADELENILRAGRDSGVTVVAAATTDDLLVSRFRGWLCEARRSRCGLLLAPSSPLDGEVFDLKLPRSVGGGDPPGRGFLAIRGRTTRLHIALPDAHLEEI